MFDAVLLVRSASPGAVLRFLERRKDESAPAEVLLSDGVGGKQWRTLVAPPEYLVQIAGPLSLAFPEETILIEPRTTHWQVKVWRGECLESSIFEEKRRLGMRRSGLTVNPLRTWAARGEVPLLYLTKPPKKIIDYAAVAVLDQRKLLVEDSPRLYRFPLC
jgi:hypothetical protein